jgi:hypothetical protein
MEYYSKEQDFESPITETEFSLRIKLRDYLIENRHLPCIDLGQEVPIYCHKRNIYFTLDSNNARSYAENFILDITNAYKQFNDVIVRDMLSHIRNEIKNVCKGSIITDKLLDYIIEKSFINNDTIAVETNKKIRFLNNPHYNPQGKSKNEIKKIKSDYVNTILGRNKKSKTYELILNALYDYDLNKGMLKHNHIVNSTKISESTIKRYLNEYNNLKDLFNEIKDISRSTKQKINRHYNSTKTSKITHS